MNFFSHEFLATESTETRRSIVFLGVKVRGRRRKLGFIRFDREDEDQIVAAHIRGFLLAIFPPIPRDHEKLEAVGREIESGFALQ